jgi:hypothetical protein
MHLFFLLLTSLHALKDLDGNSVAKQHLTVEASTVWRRIGPAWCLVCLGLPRQRARRRL